MAAKQERQALSPEIIELHKPDLLAMIDAYQGFRDFDILGRRLAASLPFMGERNPDIAQVKMEQISAFGKRDQQIAELLAIRERLKEKTGVSVMKVNMTLIVHPYEMPLDTPPQEAVNFLPPVAMNDCRVNIVPGASGDGYGSTSRLHKIRQAETDADETEREEDKIRVRNSSDVLRIAKPIALVAANPTKFIKRTLFEIDEIEGQMRTQDPKKKQELDHMKEELVRKRILRFFEEGTTPPGISITRVPSLSTEFGALRVHVRGDNPREARTKDVRYRLAA